MNILILVSSLNYGGAEKQAVLDANMLVNKANIYFGMFKDGALRELLDERVKVVDFHKQGYLKTASNLAEFITENNIEVVHNHLYAPMIISALASIKSKVPVLWHFHGHHFEVRKLPLNILSHLHTVKHAIFVCAALAKYFEKNYRFPKKKIEVVYNSSQCRKLPELRPGDSTLRIGFIGRLVKLKRVHFLIAVAEHLKKEGITDFEILLAGDGPEREALETLAKKKGVEKEMKFLGFRSDIESLYNQFDLFVLPSDEEALSLALIDAGRVAVPSLAFDVGGNKEIIKNGETGFIVHYLEELKEKVSLLCRDEALRKKMGEKAEKHTRIFSEENHLQSLLNLYKGVMENS
jgi:glycosyltransferase involved in cell wall biosynthesis